MKLRKLWIFVVLWSIVIGHTTSSKLPASWREQLGRFCEAFQSGSAGVQILDNSIPLVLANEVPALFLMPPVILWSPVEEFSFLPNPIRCPKCENGSLLKQSRWQNGLQGDHSEPRKIHGVDGPVLLVGRVYKCEHGHEVLGYHPGVLRQIPAQSIIPFRLWHKTGFTVQLMSTIMSLVASGTSLNHIRAILVEKQRTRYCLRRRQYMELMKVQQQEAQFLEMQEYETYFACMSPSQQTIAGCYLADFWEKEKFFTHCMAATSVDDNGAWLSCDHTFASAGKSSWSSN